MAEAVNNVSTKVVLAGTELKNPVMPASGTFGYGMEYAQLYDLNILGAVVTKSATAEERYGNALPRIAETEKGMLNSIGLQNPGIEHVTKVDIPELAKIYSGPVIANISGFSEEEFALLARAMDEQKDVDMIEVNISCPNVKEGGFSFGVDPVMSEKITRTVKDNTSKPVIVKLTPNVTDITVIAKACEAGGADAISAINNFRAMRIDIVNRKTVTAEKYAGLSGPAIRPIAMRMVNEIFHSVSIPVIGVGGIACADDVIEMIMAGATAVQIGSANLADPMTLPEIIEALPLRMAGLGIKDLSEIKGVV